MLPHDFDLQISHLQTLADRDAVVTLFANLGYNTDARLPMTIAAMGFTGDSLAHEITHIERIADHEQGELQVYLIELRRVTVALTQAIARALRNRAGNFLLVLTSDYERLDFVLMELTPPESKQTGLGAKQAFLRPHILTLNRRDPGMVALRVLRRFSYTEIDADYQWDKLRSAYGIAEWSEPFFDNRALFSDYYLTERLKDSKEWQENPAPALREFQKLFTDIRPRVARQKEEIVRRELVEPALKTLGFGLTPGKPSKSDAVEADYHLLADAHAERAQPIAFCNAYVWDRNLDARDETRDGETPDENPGALVVSLLEKDDAPDWAIVTNGKVWRLYSARTHSRATNYYEIDLEEALASPDPQFAFRYFWLMFRAAAFTPTQSFDKLRTGSSPVTTGEGSFLSRVLEASSLYAKELGERLKDRVFEGIFPHLAEGFIADMRARNLGGYGEPSLLDDVFHGTLTFLYRLLFLLYAESRDLLPVREERGYYEISLTRLKNEIAEHAEKISDAAPGKIEKAYSATSTALYDRLSKLFAVIDRGDASLNVPLYNGGLFITQPSDDDASPEAANARFLAAHKIPDRALALGIDLMARDLDPKTHALAMIDYKSLGVRQLGSVYEGLLEFKVRVASEKMAVVKGKKTDEVVNLSGASRNLTGLKVKATIAKGAVYLENDKRERKATGSFYTPDYIVKYIVQHTVGPVLDEKFEQLRPKLREAQKKYREAQDRQKAFVKQGMTGDDPAKVAHTFRQVVDELFGLRVLDPGMGSGHFLVETVDYVTDRMLDFLNAFPWNPVTAALRETRETILGEMQTQGVSIDAARLTDVNLLKRHILKRCIYGVDLNPMAVELAKVSLWLDCFTLGAPLSFLDHHLKCGNSLIGARIVDVQSAIDVAAQKDRMDIPMLAGLMGSEFAGVMLAVDLMRQVGNLSDVTAEQVRKSRAEFRRATDALAPYKHILDVYTSRWFGNADTKFNQPAIQFLRDEKHQAWLRDPEKARAKLRPADQKIADTALTAAAEKKFLHWELEFPEVFFGPSKASAQAIVLKENPGFDAVVGNPPYVRVQLLGYDDTDFFKSKYISAYRRVDIATLFLEQSINVLCNAGISGLILSSQFMTADYGQSLRGFLLERVTPTILDLKDLPVFEDALTYVCICLSQKTDSPNIFYADLFSMELRSHPERIADVLEKIVPRLTDKARLGNTPWLFGTERETDIFGKLGQVSDKLGTVGEARTGLFTGLDEVMMIYPEDEKRLGLEKEILLPVASGTEPDRYFLNPPYKKVIYPYKEVGGETILIQEDELRKRYPRAFAYLKQAKSRLESRRDSRKEFSDNKTWYQLTRFGSLSHFRSQKILTPGEVQKNSFCLDEEGLAFSVARVFAITSNKIDLYYLLSVLNSRLVEYQLRKISPPKQGGYSAYSSAFLEQAFIRRIHFTTPAAQRKTRVAALVAQYTQNQDAELLAEVERCLPKNADGTFLAFAPNATGAEEHSDVVHDLLAHLAEQMIALNKQKQAEQKRFLGWLEGVISKDEGRRMKDEKLPPSSLILHPSLDALTGKTTLRNYLGDYQKGKDAVPFDAIVDVLHKNRTRIGVSVNDARFIAKLKAEYEKSLGVLLPIKAQLKRTDTLIDQVVYRLYGLTEEEVKVVEGK